MDRYEEALERAKQGMPMDEVFPELKESEGERIRKALLWHLKADVDFVSNGVTKAECLAWLEKLRENPKSADSISSDCASDAKLEIPSDYPIGFPFDSEVKNTMCDVAQGDRDWKNPEDVKFCSDRLLAIVHDALEKQKEQKPVHTAKEMWKEMRLEVYAQASGNRHEPNYSDDSTKMFSLCDIDEIFEKIGDSTVGSQPEEWSKKDESYLQTVINEMEANKKEALEYEHKKYDTIILWLKSFRSRPKTSDNWKPSEEQMEALNRVTEDDPYLESLYDDLKKLM